MKPTLDAYTVAMPWYERDDFQQIWELAHDRDEMPSDYDTWHRNAVAVMNGWLARGRALEIVTIKPAEFLAWLKQTGLPNTAAVRLKFVEQRADHQGHNVA
ncbi:MAG: hypothetical protein J0I42_15140 [Bosea sp.]|uniref:hypothetical protein n=1 Tax=Bosea sp. (in: a-proteobacteria) TaxID=1871050 RepID=UPI001AC853CE|nr:hypothetical protein [Bosea sp. (in: a-proteobacteria)]MBN9453282.1 hypothetical protein [Bosea sp. (in: a-proteobacteria)]